MRTSMAANSARVATRDRGVANEHETTRIQWFHEASDLLENAPEGVRIVLERIPSGHIEALALSAEAEDLAADGSIGARMRADALHIALATWRASMSSSVGTSSTS